MKSAKLPNINVYTGDTWKTICRLEKLNFSHRHYMYNLKLYWLREKDCNDSRGDRVIMYS